MTGPDVEFLDPDGRPAGADETLDAGPTRRPRRRWPFALAAVVVAAAVGTAVVAGRGDRPDDGPSGPVIPDYASLPSGTPSVGPARDVACPRLSSCRLRPATPATLVQVGLALRPVIGSVRTLSVVDAVRPDGAVAERTIGATGEDGARVAVVVSTSDRPPRLTGFTRGVVFGRSFAGDFYVNAALSPPRTEVRAITRLERVTRDPRLLP